MQILFIFIIYLNHKIDKPHIAITNDFMSCSDFAIQRKKTGNTILPAFSLVRITGLEPA